MPRNYGPPYDRVVLDVNNSANGWQVDTDYWITITGTWGWSATAPAPIKQACLRLAAHAYRMRDSDVFDVVSFPGEGIIQLRSRVPADIMAILDQYTKRI